MKLKPPPADLIMPKVKTPRKRHCPICDVKHLPGEHLQARLPYDPTVTQSTAPLKEQPNFPVSVLAEPLHHLEGRGEARESTFKRQSGKLDSRGGENKLSGSTEAAGEYPSSDARSVTCDRPGRADLQVAPEVKDRDTPLVPSASVERESSDSPAHTLFGSKEIRPVAVVTRCEMGHVKNSEVQSEKTEKVPQLGPGVYEKIAPDIYHQQNSFSRGDMLLAAVPAKLKWHKDHPQIDKPTPAKILGGAFHTKLLEPEVFDSRYILSRYAEYRTNEAKTWRDEQTDKGLTVLSKEDIDMIDQMCQSCREQANFHKVFARAGMRRELTVVAKDPATGLLLRARYDIVPGGNVIPDIKSAMDASPEGFGKAAWNMEYGAQAAHYLYVWNLAHPNNQRREFVFLVQEKDPPYLSNMFITPYSLIEYWDKILRARRYVIAQCLATNTWPGYDVHPLERNEFELPRYAVYDIEKTQDNG